MNLRRNVLSKLVFIFVLFLSNVVLASQSIIIYRDFGHKGDENQARGVVRACAQRVKDLKVEEFNLGQEEQLRSSVKTAIESNEEKPIVLCVGEKTVSSFSKLLPFEGTTSIHLCHMVTPHHPDLLGKVDFIALPIHAVRDLDKTAAGSKTQIIKTTGVAHNRQIEEIERIYLASKANIPQSDSYLGVILAGDAPTSENKIQVFTEANARELAHYVASILNNRHLLIINGPRTGKYDPQTLVERKEGHRDGQKDFITLAFLDELSKSNVTPKQFSLFDFQFGAPQPQDMDLLLGAVRATNSTLLVPGESTSSISESVDVLPLGAVVVYHNTAMNEVHAAHVQSELEAGRIKVLQQGFKEMDKQKDFSQAQGLAPQSSAAETIAALLLN